MGRNLTLFAPVSRFFGPRCGVIPGLMARFPHGDSWGWGWSTIVNFCIAHCVSGLSPMLWGRPLTHGIDKRPSMRLWKGERAGRFARNQPDRNRVPMDAASTPEEVGVVERVCPRYTSLCRGGSGPHCDLGNRVARAVLFSWLRGRRRCESASWVQPASRCGAHQTG
jgi:hypothetical protein